MKNIKKSKRVSRDSSPEVKKVIHLEKVQNVILEENNERKSIVIVDQKIE